MKHLKKRQRRCYIQDEHEDNIFKTLLKLEKIYLFTFLFKKKNKGSQKQEKKDETNMPVDDLKIRWANNYGKKKKNAIVGCQVASERKELDGYSLRHLFSTENSVML